MSPFRQYASQFIGLSMVWFLLSGCAGLGKRLEPPRVTLANIKVQEVKVFESIFQIEIRLYNTNDVAFDIKGIDCDLELNGKRFASGVSNFQVEIPPYETSLIPITVYSSVLDVLMGLHGLSKTEKIEYKIAGRLRLGKGALPSVVSFKAKGELPLEGLSHFKNPQP